MFARKLIITQAHLAQMEDQNRTKSFFRKRKNTLKPNQNKSKSEAIRLKAIKTVLSIVLLFVLQWYNKILNYLLIAKN